MKDRIKSFFLSEKGDTNYIALIILLAVAIILAGLFKELVMQGMHTVVESVKNFLRGLGFPI